MGDVSGQFQVNGIDHALAEGQQVNNGRGQQQFNVNEMHHTQAEG
jgi:hypothetical protein